MNFQIDQSKWKSRLVVLAWFGGNSLQYPEFWPLSGLNDKDAIHKNNAQIDK